MQTSASVPDQVKTVPLVESWCKARVDDLPWLLKDAYCEDIGATFAWLIGALVLTWVVWKPAAYALGKSWQWLRQRLGGSTRGGQRAQAIPTVSQWRALHRDQLQRLEQTDIGLRLDTGLASPPPDRSIDPDDRRLIDLRVDTGLPRRGMFRWLLSLTADGSAPGGSLQHAINNAGTGVFALIGDAGTGKSTSLQRLARTLLQRGQPGHRARRPPLRPPTPALVTAGLVAVAEA